MDTTDYPTFGKPVEAEYRFYQAGNPFIFFREEFNFFILKFTF